MTAIPARENILLVGSIPQPIGGVTQHVWRLGSQLSRHGCAVCDLHPSLSKYALPGVDVRVAPANRWARFPWLLRQIDASPAKVVHYHFSTTRMLPACGFFLKRAASKHFTVLTLHDGDQLQAFERLGRLTRRLAIASLHDFDRIITLSSAQDDFYRKTVRIPDERLSAATSFINLSPELVAGLPPATHRARTAVPASADLLLVASGFPDSLYRHEHCIRLVDQLRETRDAHLLLCLYGHMESQSYLDDLQRQAATRPHVRLLFGLDYVDFLEVLGRADLYLRPTTRDSFGLAVADAIGLGVPAVASDVCDRCPGTVTFPAGTYERFAAAALATLDRAAEIRRQLAERPIDDGLAATLASYRPALDLSPIAQAPRKQFTLNHPRPPHQKAA